MKIENFKFKISVSLLFYFCISSFTAAALAATNSPNFNLEIDDINTAPDKTIPTPTKNTSSARPDSEEKIVKSGLQSIYQTGPVSFYINTDILDFGQLSPSNPVIRNIVLSATSQSLNYQILTFENNPPRTINNQTIPDTTCDNGVCNEQQSALWENNLTYGLGFRCASKSILFCIGDFDKDYHKQFSNIADGEKFTAIIDGSKSPEPQEAEISLKINASGTQVPGLYSNTVTFILVPNY